MVKIELESSVKIKNHLSSHLDRIKSILNTDYEINDSRIDDISQRLFIYINKVSYENKKRWFSNKTYEVKNSNRICWLCYQDNYGIYLYPDSTEETIDLAKLLEQNGYNVKVLVKDEKYLNFN